MKRLLALILSLLFCFSLLVSCNEEEGSSSQESTMPDIDFVIDEPYRKYSIESLSLEFQKEHLDCYDDELGISYGFGYRMWIIDTFEELSSFMEHESEMIIREITSDDFKTHFVYAYAYKATSKKEQSYGLFTRLEAREGQKQSYSITSESVGVIKAPSSSGASPTAKYFMDVVLVPRANDYSSESVGEIQKIHYEHSYYKDDVSSYKTYASTKPYVDGSTAKQGANQAESPDTENGAYRKYDLVLKNEASIKPMFYFDGYDNYMLYERIMDYGVVAERTNEITEETFQDNFVLLINGYGNEESLTTQEKSKISAPVFSNLRKNENGYVMDLEYTRGEESSENASLVFFLVIPRLHCDNPAQLNDENLSLNIIVRNTEE